jgi:DNA-3-methyladenine glycosylase II
MSIDRLSQVELPAAVRELKKRDSVLAAIIEQVGPCRLKRGEQGLAALAFSIAGQQLSGYAARAIRSRLQALFGNDGIEPEQLAKTSEEELRGTGISWAKARCLRSLADHVLSGNIDFDEFDSQDDEDIIRTLTQVKGIGRWTAEMYLMFSLNRPDVFPIDDLSLRTAMRKVYALAGDNYQKQACQIADGWRPYRSVACWYLYAHLDESRERGARG